MNIKRYFFCFTIFMTFSVGKAFSIEIPMDLVSWKYNGGRLICNLEYNIPQYGKFYFRSIKQSELLFNLELNKHSDNWTKSYLFSKPAPWSNKTKQKLISDKATIFSNKISFHHNDEILLDALTAGKWLKVIAKEDKASTSSEYVIPMVRIQNALSEFKRCKSRLPEMSFAEARDTAIYFESGQSELSDIHRKYIHALYSYLDADNHIDKVLIDGHTDSTGSSVANLNISAQRAKLVADELGKLGMNERKIELRAHGSRYPVSTNTTKAGQATNRRVTIRLVRDTEKVMPVNKAK